MANRLPASVVFVGSELPEVIVFVEGTHVAHLHRTFSVYRLGPSNAKAVEDRHKGVELLRAFPHVVPDSLGSVGIAGAAGLHADIRHAAQHVCGAQRVPISSSVEQNS